MFNFFFGILIYPVQEIHKHCPQEAWPEIKKRKFHNNISESQKQK
jgi:hypothetical protein